MITNERQYRISKAQQKRFHNAIGAFNIEEVAKRSVSSVLAKAELAALMSEADHLESQIEEYETLKSGSVTRLKAASLEELPTVLIKARIAKGMSQRELADVLGIKEQQIQRYESNNYASASLRRLSAVVRALDLNISEVAELSKAPREKNIAETEELIFNNFPIKEMYRRGWFEDFTGSLDAALTYGDELVAQFIDRIVSCQQPALLRGRARFGSQMDRYSLLAWQCRVSLLAEMQQLESDYTRDILTKEWFRNLAKESRFEDGPRRAKEYLSGSGIPLVIEPHLPQTYLDGAAFLLPNGRPVIGLTLRFDRLDNFWFALFHELAHVVNHLQKSKIEAIFDDLEPERDDPESERDDLEQKADEYAGDMLIPDEVWEIALARYLRTEELILSLSNELEINPAIIAGRIRKEANNYLIFGNLVGQGEVRKYFSDVHFG